MAHAAHTSAMTTPWCVRKLDKKVLREAQVREPRWIASSTSKRAFRAQTVRRPRHQPGASLACGRAERRLQTARARAKHRAGLAPERATGPAPRAARCAWP